MVGRRRHWGGEVLSSNLSCGTEWGSEDGCKEKGIPGRGRACAEPQKAKPSGETGKVQGGQFSQGAGPEGVWWQERNWI